MDVGDERARRRDRRFAPGASCAVLLCLAGSATGQERARDTPQPVQRGVATLVDRETGARTRFAALAEAVAAADEGDTVLLSDGVFSGPGNRGILVDDKNLVVRSVHGPSACTIDCGGADRAFHFASTAVDGRTRLSGIRFTHGSSDRGGAVWCEAGAAPTIEDCVFEGNASRDGGALYYQALPSLPPGRIERCTFRDNTALGDGGGARVSNARMDRCVFLANDAGSGGGAYVFLQGAVSNTLLVRNSARNSGGALAFDGDQIELTGCTIAENTAAAGGGLSLGLDPETLVVNTVLWDNSASSLGSQATYTVFFPGSNPTFDHCLVQGGSAGVQPFQLGGAGTPSFVGLVTQDPRFADAAADDYTLSARSPAIDAGSPAYVPFPNEADLEHQPRRNGVVDIGSDERWEGLTAGVAVPARAGEPNRVEVAGGSPGEPVWLLAAPQEGFTPVPLAACPDLAIALFEPSLVGMEIADPDGRTVQTLFVPPDIAGLAFSLQAIQLVGWPITACRTSNVSVTVFR